MRFPANRCFKFLPLVFVIGIEGFVMFTPYLIVVMTIAYLVERLRSAPAPLPLPA